MRADKMNSDNLTIKSRQELVNLIDLNLICNIDTVGNMLNVKLNRKSNFNTLENRRKLALKYSLCSSLFAICANAIRREIHNFCNYSKLTNYVI